MYSHQYPAYAQQALPPVYQSYPPAHSVYPVHSPPYGQYAQQYAPMPPPPPDPHAMSPEEFGQWYSSKLSELVVNNRNIIQGLAFIASDNAQRLAHVIADCIELHIRKAHHTMKLPAWYLLDSIAKNIGHPYVHLFGRFVVRLFLDSYFAVDIPTRSKMEEMLVTWRTGGPRGVELFGMDVQGDIERGVWPPASTSVAGPSIGRPTGPTKSQVLTELEVTLAQKVQAVKSNPNDDESLAHIDALHQLRQLIQSSSVSPAELSTIVNQLRSLARSAASAAPPLPFIIPPPAVYPPPGPQQAAYPAPGSGVYPPPGRSTTGSVSLSSTPASVPTPPPVSVAAPPAPDISALFRNLVKAGVVTAPAPVPATLAPPAMAPALNLASLSSLSSLLAASALASKTQSESSSLATSMTPDPHGDAVNAYEQNILNMDVVLTSAGIQRERAETVSLLYERLPIQCKQCALRFPNDGAESKKKYEDHIDMHFRQNLRNATAAASGIGVGTMGRGYTRSWFVGRKDWVNDVSAVGAKLNDKGKGRALSPSGGAKLSAEEREAKLRASYVVVPSGDEAKSIKCPICKEEMKTDFLEEEEEEEWVWRNAISVKGRIYHATCHSDAVAASIARLKTEVNTGRSRSQTPDRALKSEEKAVNSSVPNTSPLAGLKRKASDRDEDVQPSKGSNSAMRTPPIVTVKLEAVDESPRPAKKVAT